MEPISQTLAAHARRTPDKAALIAGKQVFSYSRLHALAVATASWLGRQGVRAQDRVMATAAAGDPWFVVAYLGIHMARAVAVPIDAGRPLAARLAIREQVEPALVLDEIGLQSLRTHLEDRDATLEPDGMAAPVATSLRDPAEILFTSGTTGTPKGVVLTQQNILASTRNIVEFVGNTAADRELLTVPLSHSFGLGRLRSNLSVGGTLILVPGLRFPAVAFHELAAHQATGMSCVPSGLALLRRVAGPRFGELAGALRYMELGSERMDPESKRELMHALPTTRLCMHYGLTEASRSTFLAFHESADRLESVGRPAPRVTVEVRDDAGHPLPANTTGRICVQAATVMAGYWRNPALTQARIDAEGWFDTGDLGYADEEGYLYLQGRADDVINVGGKKVYPTAIEETAMRFPGVREAACVATSDPAHLVAEVPVLYVVPDEDNGAVLDADALLAFLTRNVELHAVPRQVHLTDALPRTDSGKLKRAELRARTS